jgi:tetratricopeptide (TPR) repeat protein
MERLKKVMRHPILRSENRALSYEAKFLYNLIHCVYAYFGNDDLQASYRYAKKFLEIISQLPKIKNEKPAFYIAALDAYFVMSVRMKKNKEALHSLEELKKVPAASPDTQLRIQDRLYYMHIYLYLNTGEFQKGLEKADEIDKWIASNRSLISKYTQVVLTYNIAFLYFGTGNYHKALLWLNRLINDTEINIREDVQAYCRIFNLIIHYELKNFELLEYIIKSASRYLTRSNRLFKVEKLTLDFMKKAINLNQTQELYEALRSFKKDLLPLTRDPYEKKALQAFDFISWINSKLDRKSFQEVFAKTNSISEEDFLAKIREGA